MLLFFLSESPEHSIYTCSLHIFNKLFFHLQKKKSLQNLKCHLGWIKIQVSVGLYEFPLRVDFIS